MEVYPLSSGQLSMLYHHLVYPKSYGNYEMQHFVLSGKIHESILRDAWRSVYVRYPILRTCIRWNEQNEPIQIIDKTIPDITIVKVDKLPFLSRKFRTEKLKRYRVNIATQIFTVNIWLHGNSADMFIHTHHMIYDGWSTSILIRFFANEYQRIRSELPLPKNERPCPPRFWLACAAPSVMRSAVPYFREYLKGYRDPLPKRPERGLRYNDKGYWNRSVPISYPELQKAASRYQVTGAALMIAVIGICLCRMYLVQDMISGIVFSGRTPSMPYAESIVGPFINVLPLRLPPAYDWNENVYSYIQTVGRDLVDLGEYQAVPLPSILENVKERSFIPFHTVIAIQNYPIDYKSLSLETNDIQIRYIRSRYYPLNDLTIEMKLFQNSCLLELCYTKSILPIQNVYQLTQNIIEGLQKLL